MGFLDSILGGGNSSTVTPKPTSTPFKVVVTFAPLRLSAMKQSTVRMIVKVTNLSDQPVMTSVDALLARVALMGFDSACINKHSEVKVGDIAPGETKEVAIPIYGSHQLKEGVYPYKVSVYAHYQDYTKVLTYVDKKGEIRVA
jgi:hypothetical protein